MPFLQVPVVYSVKANGVAFLIMKDTSCSCQVYIRKIKLKANYWGNGNVNKKFRSPLHLRIIILRFKIVLRKQEQHTSETTSIEKNWCLFCCLNKKWWRRLVEALKCGWKVSRSAVVIWALWSTKKLKFDAELIKMLTKLATAIRSIFLVRHPALLKARITSSITFQFQCLFLFFVSFITSENK